MNVSRVILPVLAAGILTAGPALAQSSATTPAIMLHVNEVINGKGVCNLPAADCASVVTNGTADSNAGAFYNVYLLAAGPPNDGVSGLECSIFYETEVDGATGVNVFQWNLCATQEFAAAEWPASMTNNTITWDVAVDPCETDTTGQGGLMRVAGYFYLGAYAPSLMAVRPRVDNDFLTVSDCAGAEHALDPNRAGWVSFGGRAVGGDTDGCNPCLDDCAPVPVREETWGSIKQFFGKE